ncbi:MAG: glycosyltransferase family 4 protein [Verrucomicrobia bacterium]|nr:glycosyltransferase family 4 protein [Verrucomicrobiota bacterium]
MSRPLIWYVTHGYGVQGGHEAHLLQFATVMKPYGYDTRVLVFQRLPQREHGFMRQLRERDIPLTSIDDSTRFLVIALTALAILPWMVWMLIRFKLPRVGRLVNYIRERLAAVQLRRRLRTERPARVHILGRLPDTYWPCFAPYKCILHHGTLGTIDSSWDAAETEAFQAFAHSAIRNFAPGRGVAENVKRDFGITSAMDIVYTICPDLRDPTRDTIRQPRRNPVRFGILCRLTPEKGLRDLLQAIKAYRDTYYKLSFLIAGAGALEAEIQAFITEHDLKGVRLETSFPGPMAVLDQMDVFIHPSLSDAMPMAIAEALMSGLPCVVTNVGGIPDLVRDGEEGVLIEPGNIEELVAAMVWFAQMEDAEYLAYRRRARQRYEEMCHPAKVGQVLARHYRDILG